MRRLVYAAIYGLLLVYAGTYPARAQVHDNGAGLCPTCSISTSGTIATSNTTASTSTTTGAITDAGGLGVVGNEYIGGILSVVGHVTFEGVTSTGSTGSGNLVFATSPGLTTPTLGVASATTINKVALTAPATGSTLTIADGKTLTVSRTMTVTAPDDTAVSTLPAGTHSLAPLDSPAFTTPNIGAATGTSLSVSGQLTSTVSTGTAPLAVSSTTQVANLNAATLGGATFAAPGTIGGTTPSPATFSAISNTGTSYVFQSAGITGTLTWAPSTSGKTITLPNGTTDFTATGGTSKFLRQNSAGAAVTVVQPATTDLSDVGTFSLSTSGTITTTNATVSSSSSTGAFIATGGAGIGGAINGGSTLTLNGALIGGMSVTVHTAANVDWSLLNNGSQLQQICSQDNGSTYIPCIFQGSTIQFYDGSTRIGNSDGSGNFNFNNALAVTGAITAPGVTVTGSTSPTNGVYLPAASTLGLIGASKVEVFAGATDVLDYAVTTAAVLTGPLATTFSNAAFKLTGITTGTNADTMCKAADGTVLIQAAACTISSLRFKMDVAPYRGGALATLAKLEPISFRMRPSDPPNPDANADRPQIGLSAENVAAIEPRCAIYEPDGVTPKSYRQECLIGVLVAAVQELARRGATP